MLRKCLKAWKLFCLATGLLIIVLTLILSHGLKHCLNLHEVINPNFYVKNVYYTNSFSASSRTNHTLLAKSDNRSYSKYSSSRIEKEPFGYAPTDEPEEQINPGYSLNSKWTGKSESLLVDISINDSDKKVTVSNKETIATDKITNPKKLFEALFKPEQHQKYLKLVEKDAKAANMSLELFLKHGGPLNIPQESMDYIHDTILMKSESNVGLQEHSLPSLLSNPEIQIKKPERLIHLNKVWQVQDGQLQIFLYTAFYDDRPALDSPHIRIISVAESSVENIICLLWHREQSFPDVAKASKTEIGPKISPTLDKQYESYLFSCEISAESSYKPEYVSIVTTMQPEATNLIKVHYPEKPALGKVIEFGHCMSVIYWRHQPSRIIEWMELHKLWGIGEFNVYVNSLDPKTQTVFEHYAREKLMNIHELPSVLDDKENEWTILLNMSPAINDCMYRNMYRYKYIVCTDTDEMIVPILHGNYPAMINAVNREQTIGHPHPSYMFRNVYFFTDLGPAYKQPAILHTQRYLRHIEPSTFGYSAKSFTDPQACIGLQNHLCWKRIQKYDHMGWLVDVQVKFGMNFHFKKCHFDKFLEKPGECDKMMKNNTEDHTMRQFKRELYPVVKEVLYKLKLA